MDEEYRIVDGGLEYKLVVEGETTFAKCIGFIRDDETNNFIPKEYVDIPPWVVGPNGECVVKEIAENAFVDQTTIKTVILSSKMEKIGSGAFQGCSSITYVGGARNYTLGEAVFKGCTSLASCSMLPNLIEIPKETFCGCSSLVFDQNSLYSAKKICESAFAGCLGLEQLYLGWEQKNAAHVLEEIEKDAFKDCINLTSIVYQGIPKETDDLSKVFVNCPKLVEVITLDEDDWGGELKLTGSINISKVKNSRVQTEGDFIFYRDLEENHYLIGYKGRQTSIELPQYHGMDSYTVRSGAFIGHEIKTLKLGKGAIGFQTKVFEDDSIPDIQFYSSADKWYASGDSTSLTEDTLKETINSKEVVRDDTVLKGKCGEITYILNDTGRLLITTEGTQNGEMGEVLKAGVQYNNQKEYYITTATGELEENPIDEAKAIWRKEEHWKQIRQIVISKTVKSISEAAFYQLGAHNNIMRLVIVVGENLKLGLQAFYLWKAKLIEIWKTTANSSIGLKTDDQQPLSSVYCDQLASDFDLSVFKKIFNYSTTLEIRSVDYGYHYQNNFMFLFNSKNTSSSLQEGLKTHDIGITNNELNWWCTGVLEPQKIWEMPDYFIGTNGEQNQYGIAEYASMKEEEIYEVTLSEGVKCVNDFAFGNSVEKITIPPGRRIYGFYCFEEAVEDRHVIIKDIATWCESYFYSNNSLFKSSKKTTMDIPLVVEDNKKTLIIPEGVTRISAYAFQEAPDLEALKLPSTFESMGSSAFGGVHIGTVTVDPSTNCEGLGYVDVLITSPDYKFAGRDDVGLQNLRYVKVGKLVIQGSGELYEPGYIKHQYGSETKYWTSLKDLSIGPNITPVGPCFQRSNSLEKLSIPNSFIKAIPQGAVQDLTIVGEGTIEREIMLAFSSLKKLTLEQIGTVEDFAFTWNNSIEEVCIHTDEINIGKQAFAYCNNLKAFHLYGSTVKTGEAPFYGTEITNLTYPANYAHQVELNSVEKLTLNGAGEVKTDAFRGLKNLKNVTINEGATSIGESIFNDCTSLTTISLPKSLRSIEAQAFYNCPINNLTWQEGIVTIKDKAFYNHHMITISLLDSIRSIGANAFYGFNVLESLTLNSNLQALGDLCFGNGARYIEIPNMESWCNINFATTHANPFYYYYYLQRARPALHFTETETTYFAEGGAQYFASDVLDGLTIIGSFSLSGFVFEKNTNDQQSLILPLSVKYVGKGALSETNIEEITTYFIGETLENSENNINCTLGYWFNCANSEVPVKRIDFLGTIIPEGAFENCPVLKEVEFRNVERIGACALKNTPLIKAELVKIKTIGDKAFMQTQLKDLEIGESLDNIGSIPFFEVSTLTKAKVPVKAISKIPKGSLEQITITGEGEVKSMGSSKKLKTVILDETAKIHKIAQGAFSQCSQLAEIQWNNNPITTIGQSAFRNCTNLSTSIPDTVQTIERMAFYGCNFVSIGSALTRASGNTLLFSNQSQLKTLGDNVFELNSSLTSVQLPKNVENIGNNILQNCDSLSNISIPKDIQNIGQLYETLDSDSLTVEAPVSALPIIDSNVATLIINGGSEIKKGDLTKFVKDGTQSLTRIELSADIEKIDFTDLRQIEPYIVISEENKNYLSYEIVGEEKTAIMTTDNELVWYPFLATSVIFDESVEIIGEGVFENYPQKNKQPQIELPQKVSIVRDRAFKNCQSYITIGERDKLNNVTNINNGIQFVGKEAFHNTFLENSSTVKLLGIVEIGDRAFKGTAMYEMELGEKLKKIGNNCIEANYIFCKAKKENVITKYLWNINQSPVVWEYEEGSYNEIPNTGEVYVENSNGEVYINLSLEEEQDLTLPRGCAENLLYKRGVSLDKLEIGTSDKEGRPLRIYDNAFYGAKINNISFPEKCHISSTAFRNVTSVDGESPVILEFTNNQIPENFPFGLTHYKTNLTQTPKVMDFIGFTFNGLHSFYDLNVYRVIEGNRLQEDLSPVLADNTIEIPNGDGFYYFSSKHKQKTFSINFAFNALSEKQFREWKKFCSGKEIGDLIFDEAPYKVYSAKITGAPHMKYICFDKLDPETNLPNRVYKGEGTIEFTCYNPYAHTPKPDTKMSEKAYGKSRFGLDGKCCANYLHSNLPQWKEASGLKEEATNNGENYGDIPAHFVLKIPYLEAQDETVYYEIALKTDNQSASIRIEVPKNKDYTNLLWDSKTGIITTEDSRGNEILVPSITGFSCGTIPVEDKPEITIIRYKDSEAKEPDSSGSFKLNGNEWQYLDGKTEGNENNWVTFIEFMPELEYSYWYY